MSHVRITIGGRLDRSLTDSFSRVPQLARKATDAANLELAKLGHGGRGGIGGGRGGRANNPEFIAAREAHAEQARLNREIFKQQVALQKAAAKEERAINRQRSQERMKALHEEAKEHIRNNRLVEAAAARERSAQINRQMFGRERDRDRVIDRLATRTSHRATRFMFPRPEGAIGYASRTANELLRGLGIDMSFSGGVSRANERESAGMGLAQQERIATGKTKGGAYWSGVSQKVGEELSISPERVTELMRSFTGKTGDFEAAPGMGKNLGGMATAAGADLGEMGSAAGYIYNQLKGMPDAAERTLDVMRGIVGQTAVGAVEMKDYAAQMGRVAANAKAFQGDVSQNILTLSALTQLSIAEGGATSGADAARSIGAFANTTSKGQRIRAFQKHGVKLFNAEGTQKRPILDIIKDSLVASKGNIPAMTEMWADTLGQKPIKGMINAYNKAGGGGKDGPGVKAAMALLEPYKNAQLDKETERKNLEDYQATRAAKAQRFQNQLDIITDSLASRIIPAFEQLAPLALQIAKAFGNFVAWATENPGKVIAMAISYAIGRALTESFFRTLLEGTIKSGIGRRIAGDIEGGGSVGGGFFRNSKGSILGNTSWGGAAAAAGTGLALGAGVYSAIDFAGKSQYDEGVKTTNAISRKLNVAHGSDLSEALRQAEADLKKYQDDKGLLGGMFSGMMNMFGAGDEADVKGLESTIARKREELDNFNKTGKLSESDRNQIDGQKLIESWAANKEADYEKAAQAQARALTGKTLNVYVKNAKEIGGPDGDKGPRVDDTGRGGREGK
jgi:hypothetical protein